MSPKSFEDATLVTPGEVLQRLISTAFSSAFPAPFTYVTKAPAYNLDKQVLSSSFLRRGSEALGAKWFMGVSKQAGGQASWHLTRSTQLQRLRNCFCLVLFLRDNMVN